MCPFYGPAVKLHKQLRCGKWREEMNASPFIAPERDDSVIRIDGYALVRC
jgi:hypothetical protein